MMMKKFSQLLVALALLPLFFSCKNEEPDPYSGTPRITLTTAIKPGEKIHLTIETMDDDVWVDINGDRICQPEEKIEPGMLVTYGIITLYGYKWYDVVNPTITIYGRVQGLDCSLNKITDIDLSRSSGLLTLVCYGNYLKSLNLNNTPDLETLHCSGNALSKLDISNLKALKRLFCEGNLIEKINVSNNSALETLFCSHNRLKELSVDKNPLLSELACDDNALTHLDLSNNKHLQVIKCSQNNLKHLDVSATKSLTELNCSQNSIETLLFNPDANLLSFVVCYNNQISGEGMDTLVNSIPITDNNGVIWIKTLNDPKEGNVCTDAQIAILKERHWLVEYNQWPQFYGAESLLKN